MNDPKFVVEAFIADYLAWNDKAYVESKTSDENRAEADYQKLLARYCRPGFTGEPISFGSDSSHGPLNETVVSVTTEGDSSIVKTRHIQDIDSFQFLSDYEYHLSREGDRWYLDRVFYVDAQGKYDCL
jgi:hypothetical protein